MRVKIFAKYFSELSLLIQSLGNYSIYVSHYNQIIIINILLERLKIENNSISSFSRENDLEYTYGQLRQTQLKIR